MMLNVKCFSKSPDGRHALEMEWEERSVLVFSCVVLCACSFFSVLFRVLHIRLAATISLVPCMSLTTEA